MRKKIASIILVVLGIIVFLVISQLDKRHTLIISEVCHHNQTVAYDNMGEFVDYVEVYNNSNATVQLSDYFLADKNTNTDFELLQEGVLEPGEYKIVFLGRLFSLSEGETLYLFNKMGKIIDKVEVNGTEIDKVCAWNPDSKEWLYNQAPSPGKENLFNIEKTQYLPDNIVPQLSHESGFYQEPFYLEIEIDGDYDIYYTLDGSSPSQETKLYKEPILMEDVTSNENVYSAIKEISIYEERAVVPEHKVDKCNIVRAIAISKNGEISKEVYASYFIDYENRSGYDDIYIASLITDPDNLFSKDRGIYVNGYLADINWYFLDEEERGGVNTAITNYTRSGKGWRRPAVIELFDKEGMLRNKSEIIIGLHGGWSVGFAQKGFNLLTDSSSPQREYLFQGVIDDAHTSLMLRPGGYRDWEVTKFRDVLNQKLVEDRDVTVLRSVPCQVFIDGEYWGLYNLQERIDRGLIAQNFGVEEEDVIALKNYNVIGADDSHYWLYWGNVVGYAEKNDLSIKENYMKMEQMIDIQSYIDYYCFQIYVANCDSVANNYACWRTLPVNDEPYYDGKWRWILYDTDDSMGMVEELAEAETDSFRDGHWATTPMEDILFSALIKNEEFKQRFVNTFMEMADSNFEYNHVNRIIDELCNEYIDAAVLSRQRYGEMEVTEDIYLEDVEVIRDFFARRREYIVRYMNEALDVNCN